jgi:hypothetical protein
VTWHEAAILHFGVYECSLLNASPPFTGIQDAQNVLDWIWIYIVPWLSCRVTAGVVSSAGCKMKLSISHLDRRLRFERDVIHQQCRPSLFLFQARSTFRQATLEANVFDSMVKAIY